MLQLLQKIKSGNLSLENVPTSKIIPEKMGERNGVSLYKRGRKNG